METHSEGTSGPEITDVNHYDSMVWVRFADGRSVKLTAQQVLDAASRAAHYAWGKDEQTPNT